MYKYKNDDLEIYFINYKKENMDLIEFYYDPILNKNYWYINSYLAYKYSLDDFKGLNNFNSKVIDLFILAAKKYREYWAL